MATATLVLRVSAGPEAGVGQDQRTAADKALSPPSRAQAPSTGGLSEEELARVGEEATARLCTGCHPFEEITRTRLTARDWNAVVIDMARRGAVPTDARLATVRQYLTRYFGNVSVNTASAEELSAVLGLSPTDANAIVEYRKAQGKFADAAAVAKVPGVDKTRIEAQSAALRFN